MKLSVSCGMENIPFLKNQGISEIELNAGWISSLDEPGFDGLAGLLRGSGVQARVCNGLIAGTVKPLYMDQDLTDTSRYLGKLFPRLHAIGIDTVVFGSGSFRRMPAGYTQRQRQDLLDAFLGRLSSVSAEYRINVVVEPLNSSETNTFLNTMEVMDCLRRLSLGNVFLLVDLFHFAAEKEDIQNIFRNRDFIRHIHIANPDGRGYPSLSDPYDYQPFFDMLHTISYDGIVCIEALPVNIESDIMNSALLFRRCTGY